MLVLAIRLRSQGPALVIDSTVMSTDDDKPTAMEKRFMTKVEEMAMMAIQKGLSEEAEKEGNKCELKFLTVDKEIEDKQTVIDDFEADSFFSGTSALIEKFFSKVPEGYPQSVKVEG